MILSLKYFISILVCVLVGGSDGGKSPDIQMKIVMDGNHNKINYLIKDDEVRAKIVNLLKTKKREFAILYGDFFLEVIENATKTNIAVCHNHIKIDGLPYVLEGDLGDILLEYLKKHGRLKWSPALTE